MSDTDAPETESGQYIGTKEVEERVKVSVAEVSGWCRNGLIQAHKLQGRWRIDRGAVENLSDLDVKIIRTEWAIGRSRAVEVVKGEAS